MPRLIATWTLTQDPATDAPVSLHWDDDARTPAEAADFARILGHTQSDPEIEDDCVSFSYDVSNRDVMIMWSEAIRLGAAVTEEATEGEIFDSNYHAACALGAGLIGTGGGDAAMNAIIHKLCGMQVAPPEFPDPLNLYTAIILLYEDRGWASEQIADWIVANNYDFEVKREN